MQSKRSCFLVSEASPPANALSRAARAAIAAVVEAGADALVAEPWRVRRIIRGSDELRFDELAARVAQRRRAPSPNDVNSALALAQLERALHRPSFQAAWANWRQESLGVSASASDSALCE
jgi:hypothetical protein